MFKLKIFILILAAFTVTSCSVFSSEITIQENHFRFENFKRDRSSLLESVYLMCHLKRPSTWTQARQYVSGEHNLWVKVKTYESDKPNSLKIAYANFKVNLKSGGNYMLNRVMKDDKISVWIQEVDSGTKVSSIKTVDMKYPRFDEKHASKSRCRSGTV